jgi:hypothetical protein
VGELTLTPLEITARQDCPRLSLRSQFNDEQLSELVSQFGGISGVAAKGQLHKSNAGCKWKARRVLNRGSHNRDSRQVPGWGGCSHSVARIRRWGIRGTIMLACHGIARITKGAPR